MGKTLNGTDKPIVDRIRKQSVRKQCKVTNVIRIDEEICETTVSAQQKTFTNRSIPQTRDPRWKKADSRLSKVIH